MTNNTLYNDLVHICEYLVRTSPSKYEYVLNKRCEGNKAFAVHSVNMNSSFVRYLVPECPAEVGIGYTYGQINTYIQRSPTEIPTTAKWGFIGRRLTTPPTVLSPSSAILSPSLHCAFIPASTYSVV